MQHSFFATASLAGLLLTASPANAAGTRPPPASYDVQRGDTATAIAHRFGCSVDALLTRNALRDGDLLHVGQRLELPKAGRAPSKAATKAERSVRVKPGDTLGRLARKHHTSVEALVARNRLGGDVIHPGQQLVLPTSAPAAIREVVGQSVGRPSQGRLRDAARLPHDPGYYRRRLERTYAAQHVIDHVRRAITSVRKTHRGLHRLAIGDLSKKKGGPVSGHASHQSGRDVDLGLYFKAAPKGYPKEFIKASDGPLHAGANWSLIEALHRASKTSSGPRKIFLDYAVQRTLYKEARRRGVAKSTLKKIFQYPDGRWAKERLVQHVPHHADHIHVRFGCPKDDDDCG